MIYSLDSGGSTLDIVKIQNSLKNAQKYDYLGSFEINSSILTPQQLKKIIPQINNKDEIIITGGKTRFWKKLNFKKIHKINEITAIGFGGYSKSFFNKKRGIVVSIGTGTCIVGVNNTKKLSTEHLGGTGIGGGTFLALCKEILNETDINIILKLFNKGDLKNVDLSVEDIIGKSIGIIPADKTAANLGRIARSHNYNKKDLAAGIVNLIAQSIGNCAVMAARYYKTDKIALVGKLTKIKPICNLIKETAKIYNIEVKIPKHACWAMAFGAGKYYNSLENRQTQ